MIFQSAKWGCRTEASSRKRMRRGTVSRLLLCSLNFIRNVNICKESVL